MIRNESEIFNVGMSKPPKVASRPAGDLRGAVSGVRGGAPEQKICEQNEEKILGPTLN